ncbi:MAG: hypothetical protein KBA26_05495 [Candidatus Delongbacteria bacterium]|nr:hypothetical protein [Candidatus Delongbacteria bacterium]
MIQSVNSSNLSRWTDALDQTARSIQKLTTTERDNPESQDRLIGDMVDLIKIPHALGYSIDVIKTYDQMMGELLDIRAE